MFGRDTEVFHQRMPNIVGRGFVENIHSVYRLAICMLAPIWHGSGASFEVVESLVHGVPVAGFAFARRGNVFEAYLHAESTNSALTKSKY